MTSVSLFGLAAFLAVLFTAVARWVSARTRRFGTPDAPVSTLGGPALLAAFFCTLVMHDFTFSIGLLVGWGGMAVIGFVDDWHPFVPVRKFVLTVVVACCAAGLGIVAEITGVAWLDIGLTVFWMVWMCHAFNVFDMADGLSAGGGAIAFLTFWCFVHKI